MFELFDFSKILESFNLSKIVNSVFMNNFAFVKNFFGKISIGNSMSLLMKPSFGFVSKETATEMEDYLSRAALRSLVGLPTIGANTVDSNAINNLKGSISWISTKKIDVTEVIREFRDC